MNKLLNALLLRTVPVAGSLAVVVTVVGAGKRW